MRNLTIKRTKSLVAFLSKIQIYIEDPTSDEISINGIPCRKLGDLKNGEEKTFSVGNEAAKVFVIADKLSKNIYNEYYQLPEGEEDISLSGKNKYNPATGNAFLFDNNENEAVAANRKKGVKRGIVVLIIAVIIGFAIGLLNVFVLDVPKEKDFSDEGMTITLTDEFRRYRDDDYTAVYDSENVAVFVLKIDTAGKGSLMDYAELFADYCGLSSDDIEITDAYIHLTYTNTSSDNGVEYQYAVYLYEANGAFWSFEFATTKKDASSYAEKIQEWAKSIRFE